MNSLINVITYIGCEELVGSDNQTYYYGALHGFTYDSSIKGKKSIAKNVPTTTGYYTGGIGSTDNVVIPINILTCISTRYTNKEECIFDILLKVASYLKTLENGKMFGIISDFHYLNRLFKIPLDVLKSKKFNLDRLKLTENAIIKFISLKELMGDDFWINNTLISEGGTGVDSLNKELSISKIYTTFTTEPECEFTVETLKDYENPVSDLNPIISANRWYFSTGEGTDYYDLSNGYRCYQFGNVDKKKKYYGKLTPDVSYCYMYVKKPIEYLDNLFEFTKSKLNNPRELLLAGNMQYLKNKDIIRLNKSQPAIKDGKDLVVPFKVANTEEPTLIEMIDPPALSYLIREDKFAKDVILNAFINRDPLTNKYGEFQSFIDITDQIYEKTTNTKGVTKLKLNSDFKQSTLIIKVVGKHRLYRDSIVLNLTVGNDTPTRIGFNSVTDPDVKVWVNVDECNDRCLLYRTIVETKDWIYIHSAGTGANVRVINKRELESLIK